MRNRDTTVHFGGLFFSEKHPSHRNQLQLFLVPVRLHDSDWRVRVPAEQKVAQFVRQYATQERGHGNVLVLLVQLLDRLEEQVSIGSCIVIHE